MFHSQLVSMGRCQEYRECNNWALQKRESSGEAHQNILKKENVAQFIVRRSHFDLVFQRLLGLGKQLVVAQVDVRPRPKDNKRGIFED